MSGSSVGSFSLIVFCPGASFLGFLSFDSIVFPNLSSALRIFLFRNLAFFFGCPSFTRWHIGLQLPSFSTHDSTFFPLGIFVLPGCKLPDPFQHSFSNLDSSRTCLHFLRALNDNPLVLTPSNCLFQFNRQQSFVTDSIGLLCLRIQSPLCIITVLLWLSRAKDLCDTYWSSYHQRHPVPPGMWDSSLQVQT